LNRREFYLNNEFFFRAFILAHLARCVAAIFRRAAAESILSKLVFFAFERFASLRGKSNRTHLKRFPCAPASSESGETAPKNETSANWMIREVNSSGAKPKVSINSFPSGSQVFIDSAGVGKTPCTIEVSPGDHSIQVVLSGFQDRTGKITVHAGVDLTVDINLQDK
jgi:hypothetical protein